jgi:hypothetical protein
MVTPVYTQAILRSSRKRLAQAEPCWNAGGPACDNQPGFALSAFQETADARVANPYIYAPALAGQLSASAADRVGHPDHSDYAGRASVRFSAETACENFHDAFPRKRESTCLQRENTLSCRDRAERCEHGAWLGRAWSVGSRELCKLGREANVEARHGEQPASLRPRIEAFVISGLLWVSTTARPCPRQGYHASSPAPAPVLMAGSWVGRERGAGMSATGGPDRHGSAAEFAGETIRR